MNDDKDWKSVALDLNDRVKQLRQRLEQAKAWVDEERYGRQRAEAWVAKLEADNLHQRERRNAARDCIKKMGDGSAWLLRKQAEAVEEIIDADPHSRAEDGTALIAMNEIWDYAQDLRQQADELEAHNESN